MFTTLFTYFRPKPPKPNLNSIRTMQDAYEHIRKHFMNQKVPARNNDGGMCRYKTSTGLTCAVGCLISDDNYHPNMEGQRIYNGGVQGAVVKSTGLDLNKPMIEFLSIAQNAHDEAENLVKDAIPCLDRAAKNFGLDVVS